MNPFLPYWEKVLSNRTYFVRRSAWFPLMQNDCTIAHALNLTQTEMCSNSFWVICLVPSFGLEDFTQIEESSLFIAPLNPPSYLLLRKGEGEERNRIREGRSGENVSKRENWQALSFRGILSSFPVVSRFVWPTRNHGKWSDGHFRSPRLCEKIARPNRISAHLAESEGLRKRESARNEESPELSTIKSWVF